MELRPRRLTVILVLISVRELAGLTILGLTPLTSPSHHVWVTPLMKELANRGHRVYLASIQPIYPDEGSKQNLTSLVFEGVLHKLRSDPNYKPADWAKFSVPYMSFFMYEKSIRVCEMILNTEGAEDTLELVKTVAFDVIIQDVTVMQCMYGIWQMAKGKPAIVGFVPLGVAPWVKDFAGGSNYPAFKPYVHSTVSAPYNLWQRALNTLYYTLDDLLRRFYYVPAVQGQAERFTGRKLTNFLDLEKNVSAILVNSHSSYDVSVPLPQNVIEIGGMHVAKPKLLPKDLQKFMDGAEHGVVVVAFGTNVNCTTLEWNKLESIVNAMSKLKQRVVWKFEGLEGLIIPKNVMIREWLPQNDIIGRLSVQEAIWHGVPVIGMPFFMDQKINVQELVSKGVGVRLDFETLTMDSILQALDEIIYNKSYVRNMKLLSKKYRDRPMPPMDLAIWHIEHAARYPDAVLACPGRFLSWIESSLLDVYILLSISTVLFLYSVSCICKMCRRCWSFVFKLADVKLKRA